MEDYIQVVLLWQEWKLSILCLFIFYQFQILVKWLELSVEKFVKCDLRKKESLSKKGK